MRKIVKSITFFSQPSHDPTKLAHNGNMPQSNSPSAERRLAPRFPCELQVLVTCEQTPQMPGIVVDISLNGVLLELDNDAVGAGDRIDLEIQSNLDSFRSGGCIVRKQGNRCGVEFIDMSVADFAVFARLLQRLDRPRIQSLSLVDLK